jgi:OOP family OmpA-OmpF porin
MRPASRAVCGLLLLFVACARPLAVEEIPLSADPDRQIISLGMDLAAARTREIDRLSPAWFERASEAHAEARALRREGGDLEEILRRVAEGNAALDEAEASATLAVAALSKVLAVRERALAAGAASLGEPFEASEERLSALTGEIEAGDLSAAREAQEALAARYATLELRAIEERTLGDARRVLARARAEGAQQRVPSAFTAARNELEQAEASVEEQPYAESILRERAEAARFQARRALELNRAARVVDTDGAEAAVLAQERRLRSLGKALGLPDRRDRSFDSRWVALESSAASLREDRDFLVDQAGELREDLATARRDVEQLTGRTRELERERQSDELFDRARATFSPGEAEVYRRGGQLIIRLRGLGFPVGGSSIQPDDYPLLAKVQKVIRTFGQPTVTIEGHTDSTGGDALNQQLSQERAQAVRDYLASNNVLPPYRMIAVGRGSADPLASNETVEGRALNRRIDIILDTREIRFIADAQIGRRAP